MTKYLREPEFLRAPLSSTTSSQAVESRKPPVKRAHIMISTPTTSGLKTNYVYSLMRTMVMGRERNIGLGLSLMDGCSLIGAARNILVRKFMNDPEATHLLMVDDDIGWNAADVFRMLESGHDFVVGAVPMRVINFEELTYHLKNGGSIEDAPKHLAKYNINLSDQGHYIKMTQDGFTEVTYAGTAFMMVSKSVIEKMIAAGVAPDYDESGERTWDLFGCIVDPKKRELNGEDVSFCKRWRSIGGKIHCLLDAELSHHGPVTVTGRFADILRDAGKRAA